jgi:2-oxoglutarate ferredoxin oxidoreductase subunit beta
MPELGVAREDVVFVSGIGCSSRFPYYMNTYGFHTIHGRAPAFATGLKCANPDLSVWMITGDGDGLSIGGNHLLHVLRRNPNINILLFNNQIYGLTKGQYSPTSEVGKRTKSTPMGSIDNPFNPEQFALGCGVTHLTRSVDVFAKHLRATIEGAAAHKGTSMVHIYQNCNIFNDGAFKGFTEREVRDEQILYLEHGTPLSYGKNHPKGLVLDGLNLKVVDVVDGDESALLVHDETSLPLAQLLGIMAPQDGYPVAVGTFYRIERPTYDEQFTAQVSDSRKKLGQGDLEALIRGKETWTL